ncbi:MAG TPA: hypothetical protein VKJ07_25145, partial [Mycobacteriales bacterium]|nr:hypothetical protein [Mycobacteriales bacterium]
IRGSALLPYASTALPHRHGRCPRSRLRGVWWIDRLPPSASDVIDTQFRGEPDRFSIGGFAEARPGGKQPAG